ncbi:MAG TPA: signal recognition particle protein [Spirochaetaceae bacterium]|nr:signal recognition particle protein [Spirochaetaceae bacterium]
MFESLSKKISGIFKTLSGKGKISERNIEEAVEEIKIALLDADVNLRVVRRFINSTIEEAKGQKVIESVNPQQMFTKIVHDKIEDLLKSGGDPSLLLRDPSQVSVVLLMGLQGNGKTTTAAKLAFKLKAEGRRPLLVACDLQRPAAIDQLETLAGQIGVPIFLDRAEKNPVSLSKRSLDYARKNLYDVLIVDTAGRLSVDEALMKEIRDVKSAIEPCESLFVVDSMLGQIACDVSKTFNENVPITGIVLTKFDSDSRGGVAMSLAGVVGKPIKFIGTGEKPQDLDEFHPDRVAGRILGMGDVVSLVEKAEKEISQKDADRLARNLKSGAYTIADYLKQLDMQDKMGGAGKILSMLGMGNVVNAQKLEQVKNDIKKERAIIGSMTFKERDNYKIIGPPRRKRIANGSGTTQADVERFIRKFEKTKLMMQKMTKSKKMQAELEKQFGNLDLPEE